MSGLTAAVFRAFERDFPSGPLNDEFYNRAAQRPGWLLRFLEAVSGETPERIVALAIVAQVLERQWGLTLEEGEKLAGVCQPFGRQTHGLITRLRLRALVAAMANERLVPESLPWSEMCCPAYYPLAEDYWSRQGVEGAVRKAVEARRQGAHYRILFPTVRMRPEIRNGKTVWLIDEKEIGRLVWAEVTVCPALDPERTAGGRLVLAPWTFFLPRSEPETEGEGETSWKQLCDAFPQALTHLLPAPTEPQAPLAPDRAGPRDYLIALHPVGPEDLPCGNAGERLAAAPASAPRGVEIGGPSLGVAVCLAAHAAATNRRIRPLIATGKITGDTKDVRGVDGTEHKLRGWDQFRRGLEPKNSPLFLYPSVNGGRVRSEAERLRLGGVDQVLVLVSLTSLEDLKPKMERDLFTDGFDGYREWLRAQSSPPTREGETAEMFQPVRSIVAPLLPPKPQEARLYQPIAWFDADPSELAGDVFRSLARDWGNYPKQHPGRDYDSPVVVCVSVDRLLDKQGSWSDDDSVLPGRLARAVQAQCGASWPAGAGPLPSAEDFAAALRRTGKLILIVHDHKSLDLWKDIGDNRRRLMCCLRDLAEAPGQGMQPQHVVLVFSDLHHQMWLDNAPRAPATK